MHYLLSDRLLIARADFSIFLIKKYTRLRYNLRNINDDFCVLSLPVESSDIEKE
jgi:hypothetical protein